MRLMERGRNDGWEGGVKFFQIFFFLSFNGDYVFQRDLHHAATRLDHQASEKHKAEIDREIKNKTQHHDKKMQQNRKTKRRNKKETKETGRKFRD